MKVVACPQCGTRVEWATNPTRPFCSERCRLIDLGAWLDEKYTIPGPPAEENTGDGVPGPRSKDDEHGDDS